MVDWLAGSVCCVCSSAHQLGKDHEDHRAGSDPDTCDHDRVAQCDDIESGHSTRAENGSLSALTANTIQRRIRNQHHRNERTLTEREDREEERRKQEQRGERSGGE